MPQEESKELVPPDLRHVQLTSHTRVRRKMDSFMLQGIHARSMSCDLFLQG